MSIREAIATVVAGRDLSEDEAAATMEEIMTDAATPSQIGALLTPVPAPANGLIVGALPEDGALVGYGDRLFDFLPQE